MKIDYHVHTPLCNHAGGVMTSFVRQAVDIGFREICFLDHLTFRDADPGLTMAPEEVPLYFHAVQRLKYQYRSTIKVKAGLEVDFDPVYADRMQKIIETFSFDVIGCSVHYLGDFDIVTSGSAWRNGEGDTDTVYGRYFDQLEKVLDYPFFDMLCHFDLVKKFNRKPTGAFDTRWHTVLQKVKDKGITLEINTSGFEHPVKEPYPSPDILKQCRRLDIPVTVGSDSHAPKHIGRHYGRAKAMLVDAGYKTLNTFTHRKAEPIPISGAI